MKNPNYDIYLGDCTTLLPNLPPKSVDMVLCDLPYGLTANRWDVVIPFDVLWKNYDFVCKDNAVVALFASQPFCAALIMSNPRLYKHEWIWIKNRGSNFANTVREPMKEHEHIVIFSKGKWTYNRQMQERTGGGADRVKYRFDNQQAKSDNYRAFNKPNRNQGELRVPSSWQKFNVEVGLHPTQKPVSLCEYLIKTYTNPGEIVLDNCMGSGTTGVACVNTGRRFIGMEKDEKYFNIAQMRLNEVYERRSSAEN